MKVQIEGQFYLESDERQFTIKEYTGKTYYDKQAKVDREAYNVLGYYTNIASALKFFLTMKIKESTALTLSELHTEIQTIRSYIESKFEYDVVPRATEEMDKGLVEDDSLIFCGTTTSDED